MKQSTYRIVRRLSNMALACAIAIVGTTSCTSDYGVGGVESQAARRALWDEPYDSSGFSTAPAGYSMSNLKGETTMELHRNIVPMGPNGEQDMLFFLGKTEWINRPLTTNGGVWMDGKVFKKTSVSGTFSQIDTVECIGINSCIGRDSKSLNCMSGPQFFRIETKHKGKFLLSPIATIEDGFATAHCEPKLPPSAALSMTSGVESGTSLEFRGSQQVDFSDDSFVDEPGVYHCAWRYDGGLEGGSCSGWSKVPSVGYHSVELKVTDAIGRTSTAYGSITVASPCSSAQPDTIFISMRAGMSSGEAAAVPNRGSTSIIEPCGNTTTPGGDPGTPPSSPEPIDDCDWERSYWTATLDDVTYWGWFGGWEYVCEWESLRAAPGTELKSNAPLRVRVVGAGKLSNGNAIMVQANASKAIDALVTVDTARVGVTNLAHALEAITRVVDRHERERRSIGLVLSPNSKAPSDGYRNSAAFMRAQQVMRNLLSANEATMSNGKKARTVDFTIPRSQ